MEIELKLLLPAGPCRLRRHPLLAASKPQRRLLRTLYFDTPDWRLARARAALRIRREGRAWVQTFKNEGQGTGGYSERLEEAMTVAGPRPEAGRLQAAEARICTSVESELGLRFETRFWRQTWQIMLSGTAIEVALDQGTIHANGRTAPIVELELEVKEGDPDTLFEVALALAEAAPLWPFEASKARRGVALAQDECAAPVKAEVCALGGEHGRAQIVQRLCGNAYSQLLGNLPGTLEGQDDEYLHQARVAVRRLRAALKLSAAAHRPPAGVLEGLAEFSRLLGDGRDWDVQISDVLPPLLAAWPDQEEAAPLRRSLDELRGSSHAALRGYLLSPPASRLLLGLARWLAVPLPPSDGDHGTGWARRNIERHWQQTRRRLDAVGAAGDAELHALRLAVKHLRYALELLQGLLGTPAKNFIGRLRRLQDDLGHYNDCRVALRCLESAALRAGVEDVSFAAGWLAAQKEGLRAVLQQECTELARATLRW